jgi:hypothetical protein
MLIHRQPLGCFSSASDHFSTATDGADGPDRCRDRPWRLRLDRGRKNRNRQLDAFAQAWFHSQVMDPIRRS